MTHWTELRQKEGIGFMAKRLVPYFIRYQMSVSGHIVYIMHLDLVKHRGVIQYLTYESITGDYTTWNKEKKNERERIT